VPKLKGTLFESAVIERYRRRMVHFMRNVLSKTPPTHREWASAAT
jgi:transposase-like protein